MSELRIKLKKLRERKADYGREYRHKLLELLIETMIVLIEELRANRTA